MKTVALTQLHADGTPDYVRATAGRLLLSCAKMLIAVSEPPDTRSVPAVGVSAEEAMIVDLFNKAGMTGSAAEPSG